MNNILNKESKFFRKIDIFWKEISKSIERDFFEIVHFYGNYLFNKKKQPC